MKLKILICCMLFLTACSEEKTNSSDILEAKLNQYYSILQKYEIEIVEPKTLETLSQEEIEELTSLNLEEVEDHYKSQIGKYADEIENMRVVYTKFIEADSDLERKEVISENCQVFVLTNCNNLELVFQLSPFIYSEQKSEELKKFLIETKGMNARQINKWNGQQVQDYQ